MSGLDNWGNFYSIIGSAAGTLIGLQFVMLTLIADQPNMRGADLGAAYSTPTIVHFSLALLLSLLMRAPWPALQPVSICLGVVGFGGCFYSVIVAQRVKRQKGYSPVFEDWLFHVLLPLAAHAALAISAITLLAHQQYTLFAVGAATLLLLFVGIHNAWDSIAYYVFVIRQRDDKEADKKER